MVLPRRFSVVAALWAAILLFWRALSTQAWSSPSTFAPCSRHSHPPTKRASSSRSTRLSALSETAATLLAGSLGGAAGVGIAYPLDTLKTKAQVMASTGTPPTRTTTFSPVIQVIPSSASSDGASTTATAAIMMAVDNKVAVAETQPRTSSFDLLDVTRHIWKTEGIAGFFGGVQTSMMGQAVIKSVAFSVNAAVLSALSSAAYSYTFVSAESGPAPLVVSHEMALWIAAATAGFVTAFIAVPCDRIKVLMQAQDGNRQKVQYKSEWECLQAVLQQEGYQGLFLRGLGPTLAREVPAYSLYFALYGWLSSLSCVASYLGSTTAPLVFGATAGAACMLPIYPIDVVKTLVQNTRDSKNAPSSWQIALELYQSQGFGAFWDGLTPRLWRNAINHAVTFYVYDCVLQYSLAR